jgi:hypothetical protein
MKFREGPSAREAPENRTTPQCSGHAAVKPITPIMMLRDSPSQSNLNGAHGFTHPPTALHDTYHMRGEPSQLRPQPLGFEWMSSQHDRQPPHPPSAVRSAQRPFPARRPCTPFSPRGGGSVRRSDCYAFGPQHDSLCRTGHPTRGDRSAPTVTVRRPPLSACAKRVRSLACIHIHLSPTRRTPRVEERRRGANAPTPCLLAVRAPLQEHPHNVAPNEHMHARPAHHVPARPVDPKPQRISSAPPTSLRPR